MSATIQPDAADCSIGGKNARARDLETWRLEPHVCRVCFGRVASRKTDAGRLYQCTNCGAEAHGHRADVVCACGMKLRKHRCDGRSSVTLVDAGIRCHENLRRSPEFPSQYTASFGGAQAET